MSKELYTKLIVVAIAFSFLGFAFSSLSGLAKDTQTRLENVDIESFSMETRRAVDESIIKKFDDGLRTLGAGAPDQIESQPQGDEINSLSVDGFEAYAAGAAPPDPPWYTDAPVGGTWPFWEDNLEDDTLLANPDTPPWETTDAGWDGNFFYEDWEDYTLGTAPQAPDWWANTYGDCALGAAATPGGGPPGSMSMHLDEGVGGDAYTVISADNFGPAAGYTQANIDFWVYSGPDQTNDADLNFYFWSSAGPLTFAVVLMSEYPAVGSGSIVWYYDGGADYLEIADDTWYQIEMTYDTIAQTYDIRIDGGGWNGPNPFYDPAADTPETLQIYGGDSDTAAPYPSNHMIDELRHYIPVPGGTQDIYVVDTYSSSWDGGTQSMFMEQNSEPAQAFTEASFGPPYMFGTMMNGWFFVQTETVATSDGAVFYFIDFCGSYLAGFRFNGGNIEYYSAGGWVIAMPYADATEYIFEFEINDLTQEYNGIWINGAEQALNVPMGENGAGIAKFRMEGTPGTPSRIWADYPGASGGDDDSIVEVSTDVAHTGTQSLHISERGAQTDASAQIAYEEGYGVKYGEFSFWFYADDPMGGGDVILFDSGGSNYLTWISIGTDLGGGEHPGTINWIDNDGVTLWIVPGPAFTVGTWNNISIRYDINAQTYDAYWNGALQGTYGMFDLTSVDFYAAGFYGSAPSMPQNFYYDDVSLWLDDPPAPPTDVNVLGVSPSITDYFTAADNVVEGTVVGTEADTHGGTVQTITEVSGAGGSGNILTLPTADAAIGAPWLTPGNAYTVNSVDTTADADALHHSWFNYDFSGIPAGSTIDGIEVILRNADSNRNGNSVDVALSWDDGGTWTTPVNQGLVRNVPTDHTLGGPADDWGHTPWTLAEIQNNLRVSMYYNQVDRIGNVDAIEINVYYTSPPANTLEHRWTTEVLPAGATSLMLYVDGGFNTGSDDNFDIGYSAVLGGPYTPIITINTDSVDPYSAAIPAGLATGAPIYLNVVDSNGGDVASTDTVTIDEIRVEWTFIPGGSDITVQWTLSADDGAGANDVAGYNVYGSDAEIGGTFLGGPYEFLGTVGAGVTQWIDLGEAADLINNIWYFVTAFDTYSTESVDSGNASKFNVAPVTSNVLAGGLPEILVPVGTIVTITANVYDDSSTWEDIPKMDEAEWYDDFVGDPGEGLGTPMTIVDGTWNWPTETISVAIDTAAWGNGESHFIYVRGHEAGPGNTGTGWGTQVGVWVNTTSALGAYDIVMPAGAVVGSWVFVSFPYVMSGLIETVLDDSDITSGTGTQWDIAKWYNASDTNDPWKTYNKNNPPGLNDLIIIDNTMGVWLHLTATDGTLSTGATGTYSVVPVSINLYAGWNLVGFPTANNEFADAALAGTGATWIAAWQLAAPYVLDTSDLPNAPMTEGEAYWVYVGTDTTWIVDPL